MKRLWFNVAVDINLIPDGSFEEDKTVRKIRHCLKYCLGGEVPVRRIEVGLDDVEDVEEE